MTFITIWLLLGCITSIRAFYNLSKRRDVLFGDVIELMFLTLLGGIWCYLIMKEVPVFKRRNSPAIERKD
jgi:hypothetical protein